jgi:hypothetical protein
MLVGIATLVGKESNPDTDVNGWSFDCGGAEIKDLHSFNSATMEIHWGVKNIVGETRIDDAAGKDSEAKQID